MSDYREKVACIAKHVGEQIPSKGSWFAGDAGAWMTKHILFRLVCDCVVEADRGWQIVKIKTRGYA